ncbi:MAG TPA: SMP-30/gluconolactonase/LRE family protein [Longimicrobium sp.]|nr:SMP-30/gluconolactonase/LRE family protein [Longimicrobium sp.]
MTPERVLRARARLGEGPVWDAATATLLWVDIYDRRLHRFDPETGRDEPLDLPDLAGCAVPAADGRVLLGLRRRIALLDPRSGAIETVAELGLDAETRVNDGACDPRGRFWFGTMSKREGGAALYRLDGNGSVRTMETGLTVSNGLGWSPDGGTFYLTDSPAQRIHAYRFDVGSGEITDRRVFADLRGEDGFPDGLAVDAEGGVWSARFAGSTVVRYAADGREAERIAFPVPKTTSCAFGGPELRDLYVTTASVEMTEDEIDAAFDSGDLFRVRMGVAGLPTVPWAGLA